jgi:hypothetical protein
MSQGNTAMLGIGVSLIGGALFTFTRPAPSESAVYIRRIVGTMLAGFGLALSVFGAALIMAAQR